MNWITRIKNASERIKSAIRRRATKSEISASTYISCHGVPTEKKIIEENNYVCPECNAHHFISPSQRFTMMFGENNWRKIDSPLVKDPDPYKWVDTVGNAYVFNQGKYIEGSWRRGDITEPFVLTDINGNDIQVPPSTQWVHILPNEGLVSVDN